MARVLKITLWTVLTIVALVAIGLFAATRLIDPNDFKPRIAEAARQHANLEVDIQGELAWTFWPSLGVSIGRTETRIVNQPELFAALDEALVSVAVWPLLFGDVRMDGVRLDGLELNLVQSAEGANWEAVGAPGDDTEKAGTDSEETDDTGAPLDIPVTIPELAITNSRVRYRDTSADTDVLVEQFNLVARELSPGKDFPLEMSLRYQDQANIRVDLNLDATVMADLDNNHYRLAPMNLTTEVGGVTQSPVALSLEQTLEVLLDEERVEMADLVLHAAGTRTHGHLTLTGFDKPAFAGELHTDDFNLNDALQRIGETPVATTDPQALTRIALDATIGGDRNSLMVDPLQLRLDDSTLSGSAGVANLESLALVFDLNLDRIRLDGYLPPGEEPQAETQPGPEPGSGTGRALSTEPLLPLEPLRALDVEGRFALGEASYDNLSAESVTLAVKARDGRLSLEEAAGKALEGEFRASAQLDASGDTPAWAWQHRLTDMQIQPAVVLTMEKDLLKGLLSMETRLTASGNSEKALMESAAGETSLDLSEGTLRGVNFHNTLLAGINDMLGSYQALTALLPVQDSGKLPRELREDTHIVDLHADARLEEQVAWVDRMDAELRKGTLNGNGWLNLRNQQFDFSLGMKSPEFSDNKYFAGRTWPIRCEGDLAGEAADWCRPDRKGFGEMGKEIAAQAASDKVKEKLGVDAEGDTAEEVIKDAAEKKAKDEVKKKVEDELKKLFR